VSLVETADDYDRIVAGLNARWRIVECRHGLQWILQARASTETYATSRWRNRSYCQTSEALRRCAREHAGALDPSAAAFVAALPEQIDALSANPTEAGFPA